MHLILEHPKGFSADVLFTGTVQQEGELQKSDTFGEGDTADGRIWRFEVIVQGDHGQRDRRTITGGWAELIRDGEEKHVVHYDPSELMDLHDGKILHLNSSRSTIREFLN